MMKPNVLLLQNRYQWEVEDTEHKIIRQYDNDGNEIPSSVIDPNVTVRVSIVPVVLDLPSHHILLEHSKGERYVRRFGRGFMRMNEAGTLMFEYLHCVITTKYRVWLFSSTGEILVTNPEYEVYL